MNLYAIAAARNADLAHRNPQRAAEIEWYVTDAGQVILRDKPSFSQQNSKLIANRRERESERMQQRTGTGRYSDPRQQELPDAQA
jgi:hypothetical protein